MFPAAYLRIGELRESSPRSKIKTRRTAVPALKKICRRRVRGQRLRHWKQDFECRTFVDFALDLDPASMLLNNPGRNCQAEAGPFRFGGHERNEEVSGQFRRNARACVL